MWAVCRTELKLPFCSPIIALEATGERLGFSLNHSAPGLGPDSVLFIDPARGNPEGKIHC